MSKINPEGAGSYGLCPPKKFAQYCQGQEFADLQDGILQQLLRRWVSEGRPSQLAWRRLWKEILTNLVGELD